MYYQSRLSLSMLIRLDPTLHFNADPDPVPTFYLSDANLGSLVNRLFFASIVSIHGPPWRHFKPLQLLNLDGDPDPGFHNIGTASQ